MNHGHDIDGMLAGDGVSARALRLHLDNSHDARTTGWDFARLHALHHELHGPRLAEIEAAANLIAERLASAEPAVVESVLCDRSFYVTDANGTLYLAEEVDPRHLPAVGPLYRLTAQVPPAERVTDLLEATQASLAATGAWLDAHQMSGDAHLPGTAEGAERPPGSAPASSAAPFEHVWTCRLQAGDETCECEAYANS